MVTSANHYSRCRIAGAVAGRPTSRAAYRVGSTRTAWDYKLIIRHVRYARMSCNISAEHLRVVERVARDTIIDELAGPDIKLVDVRMDRQAVQVAVGCAVAVVDEDRIGSRDYIVRTEAGHAQVVHEARPEEPVNVNDGKRASGSYTCEASAGQQFAGVDPHPA
jgi:hypothetical protein